LGITSGKLILLKKIVHLFSELTLFRYKYYFGFIRGHDYISNNELDIIRNLVGNTDNSVIEEFEKKFSLLIGDGEAVSYASGRMGFFDLLKELSVGTGDEIIVPGATCAVMINAILRVGAKPVYSDIDPYTFGSDPVSIEKSITPDTKLIIAQHSFGIPCRIGPIAKVSAEKNIFLLEDCALTLDSNYENKSVGNFGNAALFSTDHSKPINTIIGGLIYSSDKRLTHTLRKRREVHEELPFERQRDLWNCLIQERKYCLPKKYSRVGFYNAFNLIKQKVLRKPSPFLTDNSGTTFKSSYPYPSKFPAFLAAVGLQELSRWDQTKRERKSILDKLLNQAKTKGFNKFVSGVYSNNSFEITPLRFVWSEQGEISSRPLLSSFIYTSATWFMEPVISTSESLDKLGYTSGTCEQSELLGPGMVNIPCNFPVEDSQRLYDLVDTYIS
jgi:perosamine synthetase